MKAGKRFFGLLVAFYVFFPVVAHSQALEDMISPITNPVNFEDPRSNSELRLIYAYHKIDEAFVTNGGYVQIVALQARYAVNDRLALIATKDGFIDFRPDSTLNDDQGFADVALGAKYAFYKDDQAGQILTGGLRYEIPLGDNDVLQGQGDGSFNPFLSGAIALGPLNIMTGTGFRIPLDEKDSTFYDFDLHVDTKLDFFYPTVELNLVHVIEAGDRLPIADEGQDFFNLGASKSEGNTIVTMGFGGRFRFTKQLDLGLAYQIPLDPGEGTRIIDWRITTDLIYSF